MRARELLAVYGPAGSRSAKGQVPKHAASRAPLQGGPGMAAFTVPRVAAGRPTRSAATSCHSLAASASSRLSWMVVSTSARSSCGRASRPASSSPPAADHRTLNEPLMGRGPLLGCPRGHLGSGWVPTSRPAPRPSLVRPAVPLLQDMPDAVGGQGVRGFADVPSSSSTRLQVGLQAIPPMAFQLGSWVVARRAGHPMSTQAPIGDDLRDHSVERDHHARCSEQSGPSGAAGRPTSRLGPPTACWRRDRSRAGSRWRSASRRRRSRPTRCAPCRRVRSQCRWKFSQPGWTNC